MLKSVLIALRILFAVAIFSCVPSTPAQSSVSDFKTLLRKEAAFDEKDLAALDKGEAVVRSLPSEEKREVSICGVIKLRDIGDMSLKPFVVKMSQHDDKTVLSWGKFSTPPVFADLRSLKLEDRDVEDMKNCEVGNCELKMSAAMITRLHNEIDWNAPEYQSEAMQLFRKMLAEYVVDYIQRGDKALLQYDNRKTPVRLADDHRMLLEGVLFLDELAPEFGKYIRNFPAENLPGVEHEFDWTKVDFGLRPLVTLTHTASFAFQRNGLDQYLIATRGIYASRYVDSSLALVMLVRDSATDNYLVFTNISRSNSLSGAFSDLKRTVVAGQSETRVKDMLTRSKGLIERDAAVSSQPSPAESGGLIASVTRYLRKPLVLLAIAVMVGAVVFLFFRRTGK